VADDAGPAETRPNRDGFIRGRTRAGRARNPRRSSSTGRPVSVLTTTRRAVGLFDHSGLFMVGLERPRAMPAVARTFAPPGRRRGRGRVAPTTQPKSGLHRYCSSCAHDTEHVVWAPDGPESIPSIRWPAPEAAIGSTICVDCGQWRAASSQPRLAEWSSWPRGPIARRRPAIAVDSADPADDWVSETRAENEGMPPKRQAPRTRRTARLRRVPAASRG
jgi:hypothetical protein